MRHLPLLLVVILTLCLGGCKDEKQAGGAMPPASVTVADVVVADCPWISEHQAVAAGSRAVEVRARVQGTIEQRFYKEGDFIREGQLMFQIERAQYEAVYDQAVAAFNNADREWKRIRPLYAANAVSQKERDNALSNYEATKAAVRQAKINLDYCQVVSPVSGYTSKETYTVGNLVSNGSLLTTVNQTDPMYIEFSMSAPEYMLRRQLAREGRLVMPADGVYEADLRLLDGSMYDKPGKIDFVDSRVQPTTGVVNARAEFENSNSVIMPGQYVRVIMKGDVLKNAILVPQTAVLISSSGTSVMTVDEKNVAHRTVVELGPFIGKDYLVNKGLVAGDRIIVDGILRARDGAPVNPVPAGQSPQGDASVASK